jgi:hypothetical protein
MQDGGNQGARMTDADPPHKIDNGKAPADGDGNSPNPGAFQEQIADCVSSSKLTNAEAKITREPSDRKSDA